MSKQFLTWDQTTYPVQWDNNPYTWDDYALILEFVQESPGVGGGVYHATYKAMPEDKKTKVIALIAKVSGKKINIKKYKKQNIKIIAKDIEITVNQMMSIFIQKD